MSLFFVELSCLYLFKKVIREGIMVSEKIVGYVDKLISKLDLTPYIGVLVYGSYVGGRSNELSDLDVMIIKDNYLTQDCGSLLIDGVRVEYFIQDMKRLSELVRQEIGNNDPSHLTKFATCKVVYNTDDIVKNFVDYAKGLYETKILPVFDDNTKFSIFSINNRMEDLESLINEDSFYAVYYMTLEKIRSLYAKINGIIDLPLMKIEKIYKDRDFALQYISSNVHNLPELEFIDLYLKCMMLDDRSVMMENIKNLFGYSFSESDFDSKSFCLKFIGKAPFKV